MVFVPKALVAVAFAMQGRLHQSSHSSCVVLPSKNANMDETTGKCKFGMKSYWDEMYEGVGDRPSSSYSWYCGWNEIAPFWRELVPNYQAHVLVAGMGNDPTPIELYDAGWNQTMTAFDYSQAGIDRAKELFGPDRLRNTNVSLVTADARNLRMIPNQSIDAIFDKGTLDAIYITGKDVFQDSITELTRVTAPGGILFCVSNVIPSEVLLRSMGDSSVWKNIHNGDLAFAPDGEATIDLGASLYSWKRL